MEASGPEEAALEAAMEPPARAARAEEESSSSRLRSRGRARDSSFTGITYSGEPSSAIMARVGRATRPPFPKEESGLPEDFDPEEREEEPDEEPEEPPEEVGSPDVSR